MSFCCRLTHAQSGNSCAASSSLRHFSHHGCFSFFFANLGKSALHYAAALGHTRVVRALLEGGASVDVRDAAGNTPLLFALLPCTAEALLAAGADASHCNRHGLTLLHVACAFGLLELRVSVTQPHESKNYTNPFRNLTNHSVISLCLSHSHSLSLFLSVCVCVCVRLSLSHWRGCH